MKTVFISLIVLAAGLQSFAQFSYPEVYRVADNIMENTSFKIINKASGELFESSKSLKVSSDYRIESPYNEWKYWNGVLAMGMISLGEVSGMDKYPEYAVSNYEFIFDNLPYFEEQFKSGIRKPSMYQYFRLKKLDDCGAMAAGLCDVYERSPRKDYMAYMEKAAGYIMNDEYRLEDGTFVRPEPREMTLWADDLFMSVPFLARIYKITGDESYLDQAIHQVKRFHHYLFSEEKGLYYHTWYSDNNQNGVAHWGRCNGWVMMAQVELLKIIPEDHKERPGLIKLLEDQIVGLSRYQDHSGLWHQLIDKPDSYLESSSTAMFIYGVAKAVNEGWIANTYSDIASSGWEGLLTKITPEGQVEDICIGTGIKDNIRFYYDRPTLLNDIHGLGAVLLCGAEMIRLDQKLTSLNKK